MNDIERVTLEVNGYTVSILQGGGSYSNKDQGTVEVGVWDSTGRWYHPEPDMDDDVLGYVDADRLSAIIQHLTSKEG